MKKYLIKSFALLVVLAMILSSVPIGAFTALAASDDLQTETPTEATTQEPSPSPTIEPTPTDATTQEPSPSPTMEPTISPSTIVSPESTGTPEPIPMPTEGQESQWQTVDDTKFKDVTGIEDTSKRDLCTKIFKLDNGSDEIVLFAHPVHYLEDGVYKDIDNSLNLVTGKSGNYVYKNKANSFSVEITSRIDNNWTVSIEKGPCALQWKIDGLSGNVSRIKKSFLSSEQWQMQNEGQKRHSVPNLSSEINFDGVMDNTDLQFSVHSNRVKENLIIKEYTGISSISEQIMTKRISLSLMEDNSIEAIDTITNESVFSIRAPYMIDNKGEECYNIKTILQKINNDNYILTYSLDKEWMENATYPVTIDPRVDISDAHSNLWDNRVYQGMPTTNYALSYATTTGSNNASSSYKNYALFKFLTLPSGYNYSKIYSATFVAQMNLTDAYPADEVVDVHRITSSWDTSVTWTTRPSYDPTICSSQIVNEVQWEPYYWDITQICRTWYQSGTNRGLMLKDHSDTGYKRFYATEDAASGFSAFAYFYYDATAPSEPETLATIPNASTNWSNISRPALTWSDITDDDSGMNTIPLNPTTPSLAKVEYQIDGGTWVEIPEEYGTPVAGQPYHDLSDSDPNNLFYLPDPLTEGTHIIKVRGTDKVGNVSSSISKSVTYMYQYEDTFPPDNMTTLDMTATPGDINSGTATLNLSWNQGVDKPEENPHLAGYKIYLRTVPGDYPTSPTVIITDPSQLVTTIPADDSTTYEAKIYAYDEADNMSVSEKLSNQITTPDRTAPQLTTFTVNSGDWTRESDPQVSWAGANDNSGIIGSIQFSTQQETGYTPIGTTADGSINTTHGAPENLNITGLADGQNVVYMRVYDQQGNYCQETALYKLDTVNPALTMTSPSSNATVFGTVPIVATIQDDGSGINEWKLEIASGTEPAGGYTTIVSNLTATLQDNTLYYDWDTGSPTVNGYYTLRLYALDSTTSRDSVKNETYLTRYVYISDSSETIDNSITILSPDTSFVNTPQMDVEYTPATGLTDINLIIDGAVVDSDSSNGLSADMLQYAEGSNHKLVIRAKDGNGFVYSDEARHTWFVDDFIDGTLSGEKTNVQLLDGSAQLTMNGGVYHTDGTMLSAFTNPLESISELKLSVGEETPVGTHINYKAYYGSEWHAVIPGETVQIDGRLDSVLVKAELHTNNTAVTPKLLWWRVDAVSHEAAQELTVRMVNRPNILTCQSHVNYKNLTTWNNNDPLAEGYNIYRGDNASFTPSESNKLNADVIAQPFWYDGRIIYSATVYYKVTAVKNVGTAQNPVWRESEPSNSCYTTFVQQDELNKRIGLEDYWRYSGFSAGAGSGYVNVSSGALTFQSTDFVYPSPFLALAMTRTYNSNASSSSAMGRGWDFSYNTALMYETDDVNGNVILKDGDGSLHKFTRQMDGTYTAPAGVFMALTHNIDGTWTIKRNDNIEYLFDKNLLISRFTEPNGNYIQVTYTDFGFIDMVTCYVKDQVNASIYHDYSLRFNYYSEILLPPNPDPVIFAEEIAWNLAHEDFYGMLRSVEDPAERVFSYDYVLENYETNIYKRLNFRSTSTGNEEYEESFAYDSGNIYITNGKGKTTQVYITNEKVSEIVFPISTENLSFTYPTGTGYPAGQTVVTDQNNHTIKFNFNNSGLVTEVINQLNHSTSFTYNDDWLVLTASTVKDDEYSDPETITWEYTYNLTDGIIDRNDYLASANLTSIKDPYNNYTYYRNYNEFNKPIEVEVPVREGVTAVTSFTYDLSNGNMLTITDAENRTSSNTYFINGALYTSTDVYGNTTTYEYFGEGDSNGKYGWLKKTIAPLGSTAEVLEYDAQGNPVRIKDPMGVVTKSEYDLLGRLVKTYEPKNTDLDIGGWTDDNVWTDHSYTGYTYYLDNNIQYASDSNYGEAIKNTHFIYDDMGRLIRTETLDPQNSNVLRYSTIEYSYDQGNRKITATDPTGVHSYEYYDAAGRLVKTRGDLISVSTYWKEAACEYDTIGNVIRITDADGNWSRAVYDKLNRKVQSISMKVNDDPAGTDVVTSSTYDWQGNVLTATDGENHTTTYTYDKLNRLKTVTQTATDHDVKTEAGTQQTLVTTYTYDQPATITVDGTSVGCIVNSVTDAAGGVKKTYLDAQGRIVREENKGTNTSNETNLVIDSVYNARGERVKTLNNDGTHSLYTYNCRGQILDQYYRPNPSDPIDTYNRDAYTYLESGKLDTVMSQRHTVYDTSVHSYSRQTAVYVYDIYDRVHQATQSTQVSGTETFTDSTTNNIEYAYDDSDRVKAVKYTLPIFNATEDDPRLQAFHSAILYDYDGFGRLSGTYFDSDNTEDNSDKKKVQEYFYNADGSSDNVLTYRNFTVNDTDFVKKAFDYYSNSALKSIQYYDNTTLREEYVYQYDKRGMITHETQSAVYPGTEPSVADNSTVIDNTYDEIGRLWKNVNNYTDNLDSQNNKNTTTRYMYDSVGNRLYSDDGTNYLHSTYNEFNMLKTIGKYDIGESDFMPYMTYEYDNGSEDMGRQTKETTYYEFEDQYVVYSYNKQAYFLSGEMFSNAGYSMYDVMISRDLLYYNTDGRRVRKGDDSDATNYYYTGGALLYTTGNAINNMLSENIVTPGGNIIASQRFAGEFADQWYTYNYDVRGSVTSILSPTGTLTKEYTYDSFGNASSDGSSTFSNEVQFTGAIADGGGVYYMNARYYNANTGRFLTQDTYSGNAYEPWTQHLYTYCGNNPVNYVDPTGHCPNPACTMYGTKNYNAQGVCMSCGYGADNSFVVPEPPKMTADEAGGGREGEAYDYFMNYVYPYGDMISSMGEFDVWRQNIYGMSAHDIDMYNFHEFTGDLIIFTGLYKFLTGNDYSGNPLPPSDRNMAGIGVILDIIPTGPVGDGVAAGCKYLPKIVDKGVGPFMSFCKQLEKWGKRTNNIVDDRVLVEIIDKAKGYGVHFRPDPPQGIWSFHINIGDKGFHIPITKEAYEWLVEILD